MKKPNDFLKTMNDSTPEEQALELRFGRDWADAPYVVINDDSKVPYAEGERLYEQHPRLVVTNGQYIYLLSPSTRIWWRMFWSQISRIDPEFIELVVGRAGTGKTTILQERVKSYHPAKTHLCAPTGVACHNLSSRLRSVGLEYSKRVTTPHAAFQMSRKVDGKFTFTGLPDWALRWKPTKDIKHEKLYVLDEAANADLRTVTLMLMKVPTGSKLILLGDTDQLQPVGYGTPMLTLIQSGLIAEKNITRLQTVHRTIKGSEGINSAVHGLLDLRAWPSDGPGFTTEILDDSTKLESRVLGLMQRGYQVLTTTNALAHRFGGEHSRLRFMKSGCKHKADTDGMFLRKGDPVRILVSDHANGVYNGQLETYEKWLPQTKTHVVSNHGRESGAINSSSYRIKVPEDIWEKVSSCYSEFEELRDDGCMSDTEISQLDADIQADCSKGLLMHAESITCHRAQGSEWDKVVVVVPWPSRMLNRNLMYVAITRARIDCKVLFMIGKTLGAAAVDVCKMKILAEAPYVPALQHTAFEDIKIKTL